MCAQREIVSFVFLRVSMFPETKSRETLRLEYTLSALLYSKERKITFTIIVFHDMTINRKFYSINETFASSK